MVHILRVLTRNDHRTCEHGEHLIGAAVFALVEREDQQPLWVLS